MVGMKYRTIFLFAVLLTQSAVAHLEAGEDFSSNGYIADFGYTPAQPVAGSETSLAFNLVNDTTFANVNFDSLWIRVSEGENVVFAGSLKPGNSNVALTYTFSKEGNYTIESKFYDNGKMLAQAVFSLPVYGDFKLSLLAVALILVVIFLLKRPLYKHRI